MKKMTFSLAVGAAALTVLATVGSAFTSKKAPSYQFTRVSGTARTHDRLNFQYQPSGTCSQSSSTTCLATWTQNTVPAQGANPNTTATFKQTASNGLF